MLVNLSFKINTHQASFLWNFVKEVPNFFFSSSFKDNLGQMQQSSKRAFVFSFLFTLCKCPHAQIVR